ncbi:MAG: MauE/DoxX family redox-associated membrane protein [Candidatus Dormibacter sp.]|uniref:MauE/DoxX family redox-associated membrane protein n=1 Tax=Candidatus Dormibacter sp. TaxID=2973982 RepID=UPI003D9AF8BC
MEAALVLTATVLAAALGGVLLLSVVGKLRNFNTFSIVTLGQLGVPARMAPTTAVTVLVLEAGLAAALATASYPAAAGLATAALLTAYVLVGLYAAWLKRPIPCACFAGGRMTLGIQTAMRAGTLALLAAVLTLCSTAGGHPSGGGTLTMIAVLLTTKWLLDWRQLSKPLGWR